MREALAKQRLPGCYPKTKDIDTVGKYRKYNIFLAVLCRGKKHCVDMIPRPDSFLSCCGIFIQYIWSSRRQIFEFDFEMSFLWPAHSPTTTNRNDKAKRSVTFKIPRGPFFSLLWRGATSIDMINFGDISQNRHKDERRAFPTSLHDLIEQLFFENWPWYKVYFQPGWVVNLFTLLGNRNLSVSAKKCGGVEV